jgi:Acyl-CoA oxidase
MLSPLLGSLRSLHALAIIDKNAAFYLAEGFVEGSQFNAVRREVEVLMNELSLCAHTLTSAFRIPAASAIQPIRAGALVGEAQALVHRWSRQMVCGGS